MHTSLAPGGFAVVQLMALTATNPSGSAVAGT